jgi:hypothetical protein
MADPAPAEAFAGAAGMELLTGSPERAQQLLKSHIEVSKAEVHSITLHRLYGARQHLEPRPVQPGHDLHA